MEENIKRRDDLERAKIVMGRFDPALLSSVLSEMMVESDKAEEADVAKVKEAIKGIYDRIPEGKDKKSIVSKAITELSSDIIEKEVKAIKENLANIDKETIIEAAKDYVDIGELKACICSLKHFVACGSYGIQCICSLKFWVACGNTICKDPLLCKYPEFCVYPEGGCGLPIWCKGGCPLFAIYECTSIWIDKKPWEIDPRIKEQLKDEIIQEMLLKPEFTRAMKKMFKKIQDEK